MKRLALFTAPYLRNLVGLWPSRIGVAAGVALIIPGLILAGLSQLDYGTHRQLAEACLIIFMACVGTILIDMIQATARQIRDGFSNR